MLSMLQISVSAIFMLTDWKPAQKGGPLGRGWGWGRWGTYVPNLNFKPLISHIDEETMLLSVFYYCIRTFLCFCHSFNSSLCHFFGHFCCPMSLFQGHVAVGILLLYLYFSLLLSLFQLIFVSFFAIFAVLCCCFKAMSLVRILA